MTNFERFSEALDKMQEIAYVKRQVDRNPDYLFEIGEGEIATYLEYSETESMEEAFSLLTESQQEQVIESLDGQYHEMKQEEKQEQEQEEQTQRYKHSIMFGYDIKQSVHIGDKEVVFGIATKDDNPAQKYMCAYVVSNDLFKRYEETLVGDDYLEMMEIFTTRLSQQINKVKQETGNNPAQVITADMCYPNDYAEDIVGKMVAVKPSILRDEYQRSEHQLMVVTGGFGSHGNARGTACFCTVVATGEKIRHERGDFLGEMKPDCIPDWAYEKFPNILISIPDWEFSQYIHKQEDKHAVRISECTDFIKNNVLQVDMYHPIVKDSVKELVKTFGIEIPLEVVGNAVSQHSSDGRIDKSVVSHASSYADSITDENKYGLSGVNAGVLDLIYKSLMREEYEYYARQDFVFNGNTRFKVIDSCKEASLIQRFTNSKTVSDPTPYIVAVGLKQEANCRISWEYGKYYATVESATSELSQHFNDTEKLAKKVDEEHCAYIDETLKLSPEEIFDRSYQTTMYADISMIFEEEGLDSLDIVTPLLLESDNVISNIYDEWLSNDYSHMEDLRETIHDYSKTIAEESDFKTEYSNNDMDIERD